MSERIWVLCLSIVLLGVWGCSATLRRPSAKEYYQQAAESFTDEDYLGASEQYQELLDQYPLNPYAEESQLKAAYGLFMEESYAEATAAFKDFERAYPTSQHMPFVKYFLGITNYSQIRSMDRDQAVTRRADGFFQEVIDRYPESAFVLQAEEKSKSARDTLAGHELLVANFNEKRGNVAATKARLRSLIEQYSETDATAEALGRLERILSEEGNVELADLAARAQAARMANINDSQVEEDEAVGSNGVPVAGVDPLLLLVSELKKQEDGERLARTEADAERLAAEKETEQEERALNDAFEDDERSYEVGDTYQEVDLEALEAEREGFESADIEALEFEDDKDDFGALEQAENEASAGEGRGPSDDEILTLEIDDDDFELEDDTEALEAAGVLSAEEEAENARPASPASPRVEETASVDDMIEDDDFEVSEDVAEEAEGDEEVVAVEPVESGVEQVETYEAEASSDSVKRSDVAVRTGRGAVLGIDIEEIDFEFEDE